ncbi:hypothetical protein D3C85_959050 [compost metagenome]
MLGDELAGRIRTEAVHHVVHALRDAHGVHHLAEQRSGLRRLLGRLDDNGVAAGQRRADLPGHQHERRVPRADHADHALGHAHGIVEGTATVRGGHLEGFAGDVLDHVGEHLEVGRATRDEHVLHHVRRLASVGHLGLDEVVEATGDLVGHAVQQLDALVGAQPAPLAVQRATRGLDRRIHLGTPGLGNGGDHAVIERRALVETLAAGSGDVLAGDEVLNLAHGHSALLFWGWPARATGVEVVGAGPWE